MLAAAQEDSTDIIAALVEAKADLNVQDRVLDNNILLNCTFHIAVQLIYAWHCRKLVGQHCGMQLRWVMLVLLRYC